MREMTTQEYERQQLPERRSRLYLRLAFGGIMKNSRIYVPYLLTCSGMVMMLYLFLFLGRDKYVRAMHGGDILQYMLLLGSYVFVLFTVIFLFYTNSFLIRNRKREFGLYNILGMGKRHLAKVLIWESVLTALISLAVGLLCGILFSKLGELWIVHVIAGTVPMGLSIDVASIIMTLLVFLVIFTLILVKTLVTVGRAKPVELLHSTATGEKPPKGNWLFALLGFALLAAAYYIAVSIQDPITAFTIFFVAVGMVILATYLLFIAASVKLCRVLQRRRSYYYKANHFISVSSMMYRMKRNGAGLASICVLSTMVLVMVSSVICLYIGEEDALKARYPRQLEVSTRNFERTEDVAEAVEKITAEYGVQEENVLQYRYSAIDGFFRDNEVILNYVALEDVNPIEGIAHVRGVYFVPLEDYNRIEGVQETLEPDEVLLYSQKGDFSYNTISIEGCGTLNVKRQLTSFTHNGDGYSMIMNCLYVIVPELDTLETVDKIYQETYEGRMTAKRYYYGFDTDVDEDTQEELEKEIYQRFLKLHEEDQSFPSANTFCRAAEREYFYGKNGGLFVLGILLGSVFLVATVLIMYYKQITEGYEDCARFNIMQKVGMTKREIRSSIRSQMLTVFLAPLLLAGLHTVFAFPIVRKLLTLLGLVDVQLLMVVMIACFLVFAVFYALIYRATSRAYYRIVSGSAVG